MKLALSALLLAACTSSSPKQDPITAPDTQQLVALYPTAPLVAANPPFAIDLGACELSNHVHSLGGDIDGHQFALARLNEQGMCEVWIGYDGNTGVHADQYCAFEPYGTATVTTGVEGMGGCGGPPGTQPLAIDSPRCVTIY